MRQYRSSFFSFFLFFICVLFSHSSWSNTSRTQGLIINADKSFRDLENETIELEGKVQVIFKDQHLKAKRARLDLRSRTIEAEGDVLVVSPEATYGGRKIKLDYETNTGFILDGFVQSKSVLIEGVFLQKLGPQEFFASDAQYTSCENCPETWSFTGSKVKAELGGYAILKNTFFRVGGIPILWFPYMVVPLRNERQSGLLTPSNEWDSDSGYIFSQPFFWAMSRSQDSTWTFRNFERRGQQLNVNYRYMLADHNYGELHTSILRDRVFATSERLNRYRSPAEKDVAISRWHLKYKHYYEMPDGYVHRMQLHNVSDLQYPTDFGIDMGALGEGYLENRFSVTKNFQKVHASIDSSYYYNLLQSDPLSTNNDSVHRLPEVRLTQVDTRIGDSDFFYGWSLQHTNFSRPGFSYDQMNSSVASLAPSTQRRLNTTGGSPNCSKSTWEQEAECRYLRTGVYDPNRDLLRSGQRSDGQLFLNRPFMAGKFDFLPQVSYRETQYFFDVGDQRTNARRFLRGEFSARTPFSAIYSGKAEQDISFKYKHEIQPEVTFSAIPWIDHPPHPFFGNFSSADIPAYLQENISDADLNGPYGLQFDYEDRLIDRKIITYGFTNKLVKKETRLNGDSSYGSLVTWRLAQVYDLFQAESRDPLAQPYSDILSELILTLENLEFYQKANYYPYHSVTNTSSRLRVYNDNQESISITHNLIFPIVRGKSAGRPSEEVMLLGKKIFRRFDVVAQVTYDLNPLTSQRFKDYGYALRLKLPGNCWYMTWMQFLEPEGRYGWRLLFDFSWDGKPPLSLRENIMTAGASPHSPSSF